MENKDKNEQTLKEEKKYSKQDIEAVAKSQKIVLWVFLVSIIVSFGIPWDNTIFWGLVGVVDLYFIYKLVRALGLKNLWLYIVGMFIPPVSIVLFLYLIIKATKVLKAQSIKVGVMGYKKNSLDELLNESP